MSVRVAVTGAAGFVGSHICTELVQNGYEVIQLVRPNLDNINTLISKLEGVDVLCHCAWSGHPRNEVDSQRNIYTSMMVARAVDIVGVKHLVLMSSGGGINSNTAYANSKREIESLFSPEFGLFKFDLTVIRPTAVYGPGQDPSKGLGAVTTFLNAVLMGEPIHILGSPYSGRDFLHVKDLAECVALVVRDGVKGTFDVGGPRVVTLLELIEMIESELSLKATVQIENPTGVDPQTICLDNTLINAAIGWIPKRHVIDFIKKTKKEQE